MNVATCSGSHKTRLFIGEGNFSYTEAFINKHDTKNQHDPTSSIAHAIISTELDHEIRCQACYDMRCLFDSSNDSEESSELPPPCDDCTKSIETIEMRMKQLQEKGVTVISEVNAETIGEDERFKIFGKIPRIHWNCPHDGSVYPYESIPPLIATFFKQCKKIQNPKHRIHITLAQPKGKKDYYMSIYYNIVRAASCSGYTLIKKRKFEADRYPGYQHTQTNTGKKASVTSNGMREFVFEKIDSAVFMNIVQERKKPNCEVPLIDVAKALANLSEKNYEIQEHKNYNDSGLIINCSSDEDSSDGELQDLE